MRSIKLLVLAAATTVALVLSAPSIAADAPFPMNPYPAAEVPLHLQPADPLRTRLQGEAGRLLRRLERVPARATRSSSASYIVGRQDRQGHDGQGHQPGRAPHRRLSGHQRSSSGRRAATRTPTSPWLWSTAWLVPSDYPLGTFKFDVAAQIEDDRQVGRLQPRDPRHRVADHPVVGMHRTSSPHPTRKATPVSSAPRRHRRLSLSAAAVTVGVLLAAAFTGQAGATPKPVTPPADPRHGRASRARSPHPSTPRRATRHPQGDPRHRPSRHAVRAHGQRPARRTRTSTSRGARRRRRTSSTSCPTASTSTDGCSARWRSSSRRDAPTPPGTSGIALEDAAGLRRAARHLRRRRRQAAGQGRRARPADVQRQAAEGPRRPDDHDQAERARLARRTWTRSPCSGTTSTRASSRP